uniref:Uncharacterized protein n=1 Tax=Anguilla anguilla TaxID=7936 RepID=A0A0E9S1S0_ANGAN
MSQTHFHSQFFWWLFQSRFHYIVEIFKLAVAQSSLLKTV